MEDAELWLDGQDVFGNTQTGFADGKYANGTACTPLQQNGLNPK